MLFHVAEFKLYLKLVKNKKSVDGLILVVEYALVPLRPETLHVVSFSVLFVAYVVVFSILPTVYEVEFLTLDVL